MLLSGLHCVRMRDSLVLAESIERDRLLEECALNPTVFDKTSIIARSYQNKRHVSHCEISTTLFSVNCYFTVICDVLCYL